MILWLPSIVVVLCESVELCGKEERDRKERVKRAAWERVYVFGSYFSFSHIHRRGQICVLEQSNWSNLARH